MQCAISATKMSNISSKYIFSPQRQPSQNTVRKSKHLTKTWLKKTVVFGTTTVAFFATILSLTSWLYFIPLLLRTSFFLCLCH